MASYAVIDKDNTVINLIKVSNDVTTINGVEDSNLGVKFCQDTFGTENTYVQFYFSKVPKDKGIVIRGAKYIPEKDVFQTHQPFPSWLWDDNKNRWVPPVPRPVPLDTWCMWSEENLRWYQAGEWTGELENERKIIGCHMAEAIGPVTNM